MTWRRVPRSVLTALVLILAAEGAARAALNRGWLRRDMTARALVESYVDRVGREQPDVWLLGNSTLDEGVDEAAFVRDTGRSTVKLSLGSATVRATARVLGFYLARAPRKPQAVVVFVSKDDLNRKGYRATVSEQYDDIVSGGLLASPQRHLALYATRGDIQAKAGRAFDRLRRLVGGRERRQPPRPPKDQRVFDGDPIERGSPDFEFYRDLLKDFAFDAEAFEELAAIARAHGVADVTVVLTPSTDRYVQFHDAQVP